MRNNIFRYYINDNFENSKLSIHSKTKSLSLPLQELYYTTNNMIVSVFIRNNQTGILEGSITLDSDLSRVFLALTNHKINTRMETGIVVLLKSKDGDNRYRISPDLENKSTGSTSIILTNRDIVNKLATIKGVRIYTHLNIKEAKDIVDKLYEHHSVNITEFILPEYRGWNANEYNIDGVNVEIRKDY